MICPAPEAIRNNSNTDVCSRATLLVRIARLKTTTAIIASLLFWYVLLSPTNSKAFSMVS
jgi:hypothetical protein